MHNAEKFKIIKRYKTDCEEWNIIKLLIALALLPEELIKEGFYLIQNIIFDVEQNAKIKKLLQYYHSTWINGFKPISFCVYKKPY